MINYNIIIPALGGESWTGGQIYQSNMIEAFQTQTNVNSYILQDHNKLKGKKGLKAKLLRFIRRHYLSINHQASMLLLGFDRRLSKNFRQFCYANTNVLFTNNHSYLDIRARVIKLYWIPDFQHLHLPHLFTKSQINERNYKFLSGCKKSDIIILSSRDAQKDLENFAPQYAQKSQVLHFVANVPKHIRELDPYELITKHSLPEKFFYLPNQFWKHKNHISVFEAVYHLRLQGHKVNIVCTGSSLEFRSPGHFEQIKNKINEWEISDQIFILGLVPHDEVLLLIRQSIAMINPSLFEGWSTTVEECKSIGKLALLSDISVHREQAPSLVEYFPPLDTNELAKQLLKIWYKNEAGPDKIAEIKAAESLPSRIENYANNFFQIIHDYRDPKTLLKKAQLQTPILFLIFNRPKQTFQVFETIRKIRPNKLFIAADGPRPHVPQDAVKCAEARQIVDKIDWECEVKLLFRDENLSTKTAVSSAINWFFENVDEGIILEDDCVADPSFFNYCTKLLERYRHDEQVMHINGSNYLLGKEFNFSGSYYFSNLCHPWGWATWKRAWSKYDIDMKGLDDFLDGNKLDRITRNQEVKKYYRSVLKKTAIDEINTWDYQWFFCVWLNEGMAITPSKNLVSNIGFGQDATHTNYKYTRLSNMKRYHIDVIKHPSDRKINSRADEAAMKINITEGGGNIFQKILVKIKLTFGIKV